MYQDIHIMDLQRVQIQEQELIQMWHRQQQAPQRRYTTCSSGRTALIIECSCYTHACYCI